MTLTFPTGEPFARGVTGYDYRPATSHETTPRLVLEVAIEGILAEAVVDTGGVYLVCHPDIARRLSLTPAEALSGVQGILLRGTIVHGRLYRLTLTLLADQEDVMIQTTAFVVAYLVLADIILGPLPSRLRRLTQPVTSLPNRLSTSRSPRLVCI
jgi:hypothetical protein